MTKLINFIDFSNFLFIKNPVKKYINECFLSNSEIHKCIFEDILLILINKLF